MAPSRPSDEVKKRIGLPLGLIVALIKDGDGNIHVNVPITGTLTDQKFDFSDAIWTAVRNVIVNVLKAPFRAIGGLFTSGDDRSTRSRWTPLVFAAGSAVLSPELERQTVRVGDFLRRAPYVGLTLSSVTSPADVEVLKERAVAARVEKFRQEQGIADLPAALRRYYQVIVKDAQLPMSVEEQLVAAAQARAGAGRPARRAAPAPPRRDARAPREGGGHPGGAAAGPGRERARRRDVHPVARGARRRRPRAESPSAGGRVEFGITRESD